MIAFPDAVFVPFDPAEAGDIMRVISLPAMPIARIGNLHLLNNPADEAARGGMLSRCCDDLLLSQGAWPGMTYCLDAACRPPDERPNVDWQTAR